MKTKRNSQGSAIVEIAPALWIVFMIFTFPLAIFGSWGIREAILVNAVHKAAALGAQCKSFQTNVSSTDLSAVNAAGQIINQAIAMNPGITTTQVTYYIVIFPLSGTTAIRQTTPLSSPANTGVNAYTFEIVATVQAQPLFACPISYLGNIPGLTAPVVTTIRSDSFFESPQGLTQ